MYICTPGQDENPAKAHFLARKSRSTAVGMEYRGFGRLYSQTVQHKSYCHHRGLLVLVIGIGISLVPSSLLVLSTFDYYDKTSNTSSSTSSRAQSIFEETS